MIPSELRSTGKASRLKYWLQWPSLVCEFIVLVSIVVAFAVLFKWERLRNPVEEEHRKRGGKVYDDELWRSCWKTISPLGLLVCRGILFLLMAGLLASDLLVNGLGVLYFYTEWTFTLVTIYFGLATIISMKGCSQWSKHGSNREHHERTDFLTMDREQGATETSGENLNGNPVTLQSYDEWQENRKKAGFWGFIMQILFQTCAGAVMLTDIVFWFILVPFLSSKHFRLKLLIGCMHSVNAFSLLIDTALNNMHFTWFRGAYFLLWTTVYIIFQWILHACGFTWWPYPFLELAKPLAPLWYFGLALLCIICYGIFALLIELKGRLFPKWRTVPVPVVQILFPPPRFSYIELS